MRKQGRDSEWVTPEPLQGHSRIEEATVMRIQGEHPSGVTPGSLQGHLIDELLLELGEELQVQHVL